jgi:hypothetical protein
MASTVTRRSVDLTGYPDLIVIMLGFRIRRWRGFLSMMKLGPGLGGIQRDHPDGLLAHEQFLFSLGHVGMRQYWRDLESLEAFTRSAPHKTWWRDFLRDSAGAGFWHETYRRQGGMEAVYVDMDVDVGFTRFAPELKPQGPFMTARGRIEHRAEAA